MHAVSTRQMAIDLLRVGMTRRDVCRVLEVGYNSTYRWERRLEPLPSASSIRCFRCESDPVPEPAAYLYLLGQYLGDGHIRKSGRSNCLSITCCTHYPGIMREVEETMRRVLPVSVFHRRRADGSACMNVEANTIHWKCVFPQHGAGMKHTRLISLEQWQQDLVRMDPRPLIRGLIHSDGCRLTNWTDRSVGGTTKRYTYPRYLFSNVSDDIRGIFTDALDLLGIAWKQNNWNSISVARREAVAALDTFVGSK
ncbi:MAG: hypothetical protein QOJ03_1131, partial [Frankiaceae bacterium]|nr:hypothetical protein [Frankiaceae bacterium]